MIIEAIELIGSLPNLYGDTAWVRPESGLKLIKKYGAHKLLFAKIDLYLSYFFKALIIHPVNECFNFFLCSFYL